MICPKCNERFPAGLSECPKDGSPLGDGRLAAALLNRSLGNFQIERMLGVGGMGIVFKARHKTIGTDAVVKVLSPEMLRVHEAKERFLREAKLASALSHPNIVRVFDFGETFDHIAYMIMEYLPGDDLYHVLKTEKKLPWLRAAKIMRQVSSALDAAHNSPTGVVIHRDLKPQNIRIARKGREEHATVLDFGIAKAIEAPGSERLTLQHTVIGTPRYMSPEQAEGESVDARTDVYALGVIAYELVSGDTPFQTSRLVELLSKQKYNPPPPLKPDAGVPKAYADIAMKCLAIEPKDRYQTAGELFEAFDKLVQDEAGAALRRRAKLGIAAALALGLVGAGLVFVFARRAETRVLRVARITADGRDVQGTPTIYLRSERSRVECAIDGLADAGGAAPRLGVALDGKPLEFEARRDGFGAIVGPLTPERPSVLEVTVSHDGQAPERLLRRTFVRDTQSPELTVRPVPGAPYESAGGVYLFRTPSPRIELGIKDTGEVVSATASVDPPARASVVSLGGGSAQVVLDLSGLRASDSALVKLRAFDAADNEGRLTIPVIYDPVPPEVEVASLEGVGPKDAEGAYVLDVEGTPLPREVKIEARGKDPNGVAALELRVVAEPAPGAGRVVPIKNKPDWTEATIALSLRQEGRYALRLEGRDRAGNAAGRELVIRVKVPHRPGALVIEAEGDGRLDVKPGTPYALRAREIELSSIANKPLRSVEIETRSAAGNGAADAPVKASVSADGKGGSRWSARVKLIPGARQLLRVRAVPEAGEPSVQEVEVTQDGDAPALEIVAPAPWPELIGESALVEGSIALERRVADAGSGLAGESVRAFAFATGEAAARVEAALASAGTVEAAARAEAGTELPVEVREGGKVRVRPADTRFVVIALEARDRAGNAARLVRRTRVESSRPVVQAVPRASRIRLHEPIELAITLNKPVKELTVNGSVDQVRKLGDLAYAYVDPALFLDTPLEYVVRAVDDAGNPGAATVKIERIDVCPNAKPDEDGNIPALDVPSLLETYAKYKSPGCPQCNLNAFSGRKKP